MGKLTHTIKGPIVSFRSADEAPIESLKLHFLPKQDGSGDPSPTNVRPITGWIGCNLRHSKKNVFNINECQALKWRLDSNVFTTMDASYTGISYNISNDGEISITTTGGWLGICFSLSAVNFERKFSIIGDGNALQLWDSYETGATRLYTYSTVNGVMSCTIPANAHGILSIRYNSAGTYSTKLQCEYNNVGIEFEPYSGETIPISWSDHGIQYGGYVDVISGKLVCDKVKIIIDDATDFSYSDRGSVSRFAASILDIGPANAGNQFVIFNYLKTDASTTTEWCGWINASNNKLQIFTPSSINSISKFTQYLSEHPLEFSYKIATPIEYDLTPQHLQTFLDYNNFWSDTNDDTEVEYCFIDYLSKKKTLIQPKTRIIEWNQLAIDGNFIDTDYTNWQWNTSYGSFNINNNIATWTAIQSPAQYYATGFTRKTNYLAIPYNHKVLVFAKMRTSAYYSTLQFRIYAMVTSSGGAHTYFYRTNVEAANTWQTVKGFITDRPATPPSNFDDVIIKKFKPLLCKSDHGSYEGIIDAGTTMDVKELMAFDLTQMFGLGNEPSTVEEFEKICQINGIDLDTYQPYDTGSNRCIIMPI